MDLESTGDSEKKGLWERARETKDAVIERLRGAEQVALEAIQSTQSEVLAEIRASNESIKASAQKANDLTQKVQESLAKVDDASSRIASTGDESQKTIELIRAKSEEAKVAQAQIQAALKAVEQSEAESKAHLKEVVTSKAELKNQFTEISQFYSEIGERKNELLELKKNTASQLTQLGESFSTSIEANKARTEQLVAQNEALGEEIRSHLQRAVGASLFSAFGTRKEKIVLGKWIWFGAMALSFVLGILWVNFMIRELKTSIDVAFIVRTVFAVLIGGFIYFCAKQYDRERRAEEEYAFKAAISVSLKPFHDLLIDSKNKEVDADFVKRLMAEIFDNPVGRLFLEGKAVSKLQVNQTGLSGELSVEPAVRINKS